MDSIDWERIRELSRHHRMDRFFSVIFLLVKEVFSMDLAVKWPRCVKQRAVQDLALIRAADVIGAPKWAYRGLRQLIAAQLQSHGPIDWLKIAPRELLSGGRELWDRRLRQIFSRHHLPSYMPPVFSAAALARLVRFITRIFIQTIVGTVVALPLWILSLASAKRILREKDR